MSFTKTVQSLEGAKDTKDILPEEFQKFSDGYWKIAPETENGFWKIPPETKRNGHPSHSLKN